MIVFEVVGISCGRLHFDFEKEIYQIRRLLGTLVEVRNDNVTYVDVFTKQITSQKSSLTKLVA
jgi:CxxC motif-containing protein